MTESSEAYGRGFEAGKIAIRLDHHDIQIEATNKLLERTIDISQSLTSTVQTLTEARVTDAATRLTTAQAVKDAKDAQEAGWSPLAKFATALGSLVGVLGILWGILSSLPHLTGG